jgi:hypothetical protein
MQQRFGDRLQGTVTLGLIKRSLIGHDRVYRPDSWFAVGTVAR